MEAHERRARPEGWEWKRLGDVITYKKGRNPITLRDVETEGSLQYLTAEYFRTGNSKNFVPKEELSKCILCSEHDIILIWDGSKAGDIFMGLNGVVASTMVKIEPKESLLESYAHFFLKSQFKNFREHTNGSSIPHVNKSSFDNTKIPLPPLPTQHRIVSILEKAEETKRLRAQADELTDRLLQSVFLEMFGDPVKNLKGWDIVTLNNVCNKITDGTHQRPTYTEKGVPFLSVKDITKGYLDLSNLKYISLEEHKKLIRRCKPEEGDILYTKVGVNYGIAELVSINTEFSIYVSLALLKPNHKIINSKFFKYVLNSNYVKRQAIDRISGIGVPDLHLIEIKQIKIPLPSLPLQKEFARIVEKVESMRQSQNQSKQQIEDLFSALMQKAFRGELVA